MFVALKNYIFKLFSEFIGLIGFYNGLKLTNDHIFGLFLLSPRTE